MEIFTQPKNSVTIIAPNQYYVVIAIQGRSEHTLGNLWEITQRSLRNPTRAHPEKAQKKLKEHSENTHFTCGVVRCCDCCALGSAPTSQDVLSLFLASQDALEVMFVTE